MSVCTASGKRGRGKPGPADPMDRLAFRLFNRADAGVLNREKHGRMLDRLKSQAKTGHAFSTSVWEFCQATLRRKQEARHAAGDEQVEERPATPRGRKGKAVSHAKG